MPLGGALVGAAIAAPIVGGIMGANAAEADREAARKAIANAQLYINQIPDPPAELAQQILLREFKQAGIYKPEMEKDILAAAVAISPKTEGREAQMAALKQFAEVGRTGLSSVDRANVEKMRTQVQGDAMAQQRAIQQQMQARGQGAGSGAELAQLLSGSQAMANRESQLGMDLAAQAQNARMQALSQMAGIGGQVQSQDTSLASQNAQIQNDLNRFNVQSRLGVQQRNIGAANQGQQFNLGTAQDVSNRNVEAYNQEQRRMKDALQQIWHDKYLKGVAGANASVGAATAAQQSAANTMQSYATMAGGVSDAASAGAKYSLGSKPTTTYNYTIGSAPDSAASAEAARKTNTNTPGVVS